MRRTKLTKQEQLIEDDLLAGNYLDVDDSIFNDIAESLAARKKDAVINIRVNNKDLEAIKQTAKRLRIKYQSLISELIHRTVKNVQL